MAEPARRRDIFREVLTRNFQRELSSSTHNVWLDYTYAFKHRPGISLGVWILVVAVLVVVVMVVVVTIFVMVVVVVVFTVRVIRTTCSLPHGAI